MPAYESIKAYTQNARWLGKGFHLETDWVLAFNRDWEMERWSEGEIGKYKIGQDGDTLSFDFRGNQAELALAPNPYFGAIQARVDDGAWQQFDLRATDASAEHRVVIAKNLRDDLHHADVRVVNGEMLLDGVVIRQTNGWWLNMALWVGALGGVIGTGVWLWRKR